MTNLAIIIVAFIGTPALAADMAVKAPAPMPAHVYIWTGWYAGVNAGASFGNAKTDFNVAPVTEAIPSVAETWSIPGLAGSDTEYPAGFIGGGQVGYNWRFSPIIVLGLEADFEGSTERDTANLTNLFSATVPVFVNGVQVTTTPVTGTAIVSYAAKIDWFGTVRGRIGYVWGNENVMSYVTGGLAYGKVALQGTSAVSGLTNGVAPFAVAERSIILTLIPAGRWATAQRA
jgi:outer membrane immunogenic protein